MKKIYFIFSTVLVVMLLLLQQSVYANNRTANNLNDQFRWANQTYAPELYLQPYFDLTIWGLMAAEDCVAMNTPFSEGFNTTSNTYNCWTFLDHNQDQLPNGSNAWRQFQVLPYEGDRAMYFQSPAATLVNDDWLISPTIKMKGGIYAITYYYKTTAANDNDFEVVLSTSGTAPADFTTQLEAATKRNTTVYVKKVLYVENITGDVNIAWHVMSKGITNVYIDLVSIVEVSCYAPDQDVLLSELGKDKATFSWTDAKNSSWEYFVQPMGNGAAPVGSGLIAPSNKITVTKTNGTGGANLQPNTWYEFFVKSSCGPGKSSLWVGPLRFKTLCVESNIPFWEGFNKNSTTLDCWTIVDNNKDATSAVSTNIFRPYNVGMFEGDQSMYFYGNSLNTKHDDWLISPTFVLDATKIYRLKYHYKSNTTSKNDFEVLLSNKGIDLSSFTKTLIAKKAHNDVAWVEETVIIGNISGNVNIAWHVTTENSITYLSVDNVFLEEVIGCPEPMNLGSKDEKENEATITWSDDFGKDWEYVVQKAGGKVPTTNGVTSNKKEVIVNQEQSGAALRENTDYEFYVRMQCSNGEYSIWKGPYGFTTACGIYATPFWEGFNFSSPSLDCWTVIDGNKDATLASNSPNIWKATTLRYEGTHGMFFNGSNTDKTKLPNDDWLISPRIQFDANKNYRLKYHYKTDTPTANEYEFAVLGSNSGIDTKNFTKQIVPKKKYAPSAQWKEEYVLISNFSGTVNIAWQVTGSSAYTTLYIDNIFVEEIIGCPEPMELGVKDIETDQVTITWTDDFKAANWEYVFQPLGAGKPTTAGIATAKKDNIITKDQAGNVLQPNTDYEFYVRTVCGNGAFSIWSGPFALATGCDTYGIPFVESFNTNSKTARCWTIVDKNKSVIPVGTSWRNTADAYQGDQAIFFNLFNGPNESFDDWLISPTITLDGGAYVLKYYYKTIVETDNNQFEVLLSTQGKDVSKFTTVLLPSQKYSLNKYTEKVVFINGVKGDVNIGWHVNSKNATVSYLYLDHVSLEKVVGCEEPYYIKVSNQTTTSMDVEWTQNGSSNQWEVIVVNYGDDETAVPIKSIPVSGTPKTTITGLDPGKGYTIYIRTVCADGETKGNWSTPVVDGTKIGVNDNCAGAINIPVNPSETCVVKIGASLFGSTKSTVPTPSCATNLINDGWFEFTAIATNHLLTLKDMASISKDKASLFIAGALYDQPCASMSAALSCFTFTPTATENILMGLTPGTKYYIRLGGPLIYKQDLVFNLCITTSTTPPITVSPSGDKYTVEELVKEVLVKSNCDLVSNVKYQVGNGSAAAQAVNTLGYFNKNGSIFPFDQGIVLSTNEVKFVPGPHRGSYGARGTNTNRWTGDKDINDAIYDAGGGPLADKRVTQLEFDFIPVKETLKFEYLFASNSYVNGCTYMCDTGALFAAWLVDLTTGEGQNLAKIKNTDTPIALSTIRDASKSGVFCGSVNPEYYWKHYDNGQDSPLEAPIDFVGMTKAMESETVRVVPGRKYHIKLAVMDFCTVNAHSSAVFFNAGSFDLGDLDLGADMLVENNNALCQGESVTINSGLGTTDVAIQWYKDDQLIAGATATDLEVTETGLYKVVGKYAAINCEVNGTIKVELYPRISAVVNAPETLLICRNSLHPLTIDLTVVEPQMLAKVKPTDYQWAYYTTKSDAEAELAVISNPKSYPLEAVGIEKDLYIKIKNTQSGCSEIFVLPIRAVAGNIPATRENVKVCASYALGALEEHQQYYSGPAATGVTYQAGDVLEAGLHTIYVFQKNDAVDCYEEISFTVNITEPVKAEVFEDVEVQCKVFVLAPLPANNRYFTQSGGQGLELAGGSSVLQAQTIYVYASSADGLCVEESSFEVTYADCPIPKGISPNGDGLNDNFDLSNHGISSLIIYNRYGAEVYTYQGVYTDQWYGQDKSGKSLPDGTYYYVIVSHGKTKTGWVQINK